LWKLYNKIRLKYLELNQKQLTYQQVVQQGLFSCYQTQNQSEMSKILFALQAHPPTDSFKKREQYVEQQMHIMQRDQTYDKVCNSINIKEQQEISRSPEKGKSFNPVTLSSVHQTVAVFFDDQQYFKREYMWKQREQM